MSPFSKWQILAADKARNFHAGLAFPSSSDYKWILCASQVNKCLMSVEDIGVAEKISGPSITALKGKT
jgi:hypothetical protein